MILPERVHSSRDRTAYLAGIWWLVDHSENLAKPLLAGTSSCLLSKFDTEIRASEVPLEAIEE